jgi:hypothetical protein
MVRRSLPLATLRANWSDRAGLAARPSVLVAQACEYAAAVGEDALARQWCGTPSNWKLVCKFLGRIMPYPAGRMAA